MTYQETLDYLYHRLPMFSRIGSAAYKKDLFNTLELCSSLGNPEREFKTIHIAGTNGKGSVSHMLAAIFQKAGYKTGLYTSPHLKDFRERIKINGRMVTEDFVIGFTKEIDPMISKLSPSFFEITVAMAFQYFAKNQVDIAVIETGLGGRLDSTNVILPELSIITNIGWDHMNLLGETLEAIASEKAGIIKKNIPVVIGETQPETKDIFIGKAKQENAQICFADQLRYTANWSYDHHHLNVDILENSSQEQLHYQLDLPGHYQTKNLVTVLESIHQLKKLGWNLNETAIREGLANTKKLTGLHGRWETIHLQPGVILDVAHNEAGMKQVISQLELIEYKQLHIILGMVKDKEIDKVLSLMPQTAKYYFTQASIPRAMPADVLAEKAKSCGLTGKIFSDVQLALDDALLHAQKDDLILVCGSVFLVGEVDTARLKKN
jgi:dihydrofolate synthase / folylpolyglutamate synthase